MSVSFKHQNNQIVEIIKIYGVKDDILQLVRVTNYFSQILLFLESQHNFKIIHGEQFAKKKKGTTVFSIIQCQTLFECISPDNSIIFQFQGFPPETQNEYSQKTCDLLKTQNNFHQPTSKQNQYLLKKQSFIDQKEIQKPKVKILFLNQWKQVKFNNNYDEIFKEFQPEILQKLKDFKFQIPQIDIQNTDLQEFYNNNIQKNKTVFKVESQLKQYKELEQKWADKKVIFPFKFVLTAEEEEEQQYHITIDRVNSEKDEVKIYYYQTGDGEKCKFTVEMIIQELKQLQQQKNMKIITQNIFTYSNLFDYESYLFEKIQKIFQFFLNCTLDPDSEDTVIFDKLPQLFKTPFQETWKIKQNNSKLSCYTKNQKMIITQTLQIGGQGAVYQGIDQQKNDYIVFKVFKAKQEYLLEKTIYQKLQKSENIKNNYINIENLIFDDEFNLIIMPRAGCDLQTFLKLKYQQNPENYLTKDEFVSILKFQIYAMLEFDQQDILLQDNKPENILVHPVFVENKYLYKFIYTDFGGVFQKQLDQQYPTFGTPFFMDQKLRISQQAKNSPYSKEQQIQNELFTVGKSMQACVFPENYSKIPDIEDQFFETINKKFNDKELEKILKKLLTQKQSDRYKTFLEIYTDINYYIKKQQIQIKNLWEDDKEQIRIWKNQQIQKFFAKQQEQFHQKNILTIKNNENSQQITQNTTNYQNQFDNQNNQEEEEEEHQKTYEDKQQQIFLDQLDEIVQLRHNCLFQEALSIAQTLQKQYIELKGENSLEICDINFELGKVYDDLGENDLALKYFEDSLNIHSQIVGQYDIALVSKYTNIGLIYNRLGEYQKAVNYLSICLQIEQKEYGNDSYEIADSLNNLGLAFDNLGEYEKSRNCYEANLRITTKHYGPDSIELQESLTNLATNYGMNGNHKKAKELQQRSLKLCQQHYGEGSLELTSIYTNLGTSFIELGNYEEAKKMQQESIKILIKFHGQQHSGLGIPYNNLGDVYLKLKDFQNAEKQYLASQNIFSKNLGEEHGNNAFPIGSLGEVYYNLQQYEKSKIYYEKSLKLFQRDYGDDPVDYIKKITNKHKENLQMVNEKLQSQ